MSDMRRQRVEPTGGALRDVSGGPLAKFSLLVSLFSESRPCDLNHHLAAAGSIDWLIRG